MPHPRFDGLTRDVIIRAAGRIVPGKVRKWSTAVDGREFPIRQLSIEAGNSLQLAAPALTPADFTSHQAFTNFENLDLKSTTMVEVTLSSLPYVPNPTGYPRWQFLQTEHLFGRKLTHPQN